jgi:hypothetical protein
MSFSNYTQKVINFSPLLNLIAEVFQTTHSNGFLGSIGLPGSPAHRVSRPGEDHMSLRADSNR